MAPTPGCGYPPAVFALLAVSAPACRLSVADRDRARTGANVWEAPNTGHLPARPPRLADAGCHLRAGGSRRRAHADARLYARRARAGAARSLYSHSRFRTIPRRSTRVGYPGWVRTCSRRDREGPAGRDRQYPNLANGTEVASAHVSPALHCRRSRSRRSPQRAPTRASAKQFVGCTTSGAACRLGLRTAQASRGAPKIPAHWIHDPA